MRISDWSSDVCSSDLRDCRVRKHGAQAFAAQRRYLVESKTRRCLCRPYAQHPGPGRRFENQFVDRNRGCLCSHPGQAGRRCELLPLDLSSLRLDWVGTRRSKCVNASSAKLDDIAGENSVACASNRSEEHTSELKALKRIS